MILDLGPTLEGEALAKFASNPLEQKILAFPFLFKRNHWVSKNERGVVNGRISANVSEKDPTRGYFGFYRCDLSSPEEARAVSTALLEAAEAWLKAQSVKSVYGPIDYSSWFSYRFLVSSTGGETFAWEPHQPAPYVSQWENFGFEAEDYYHSRSYTGILKELPSTQSRYDEFFKNGFRVRPIELTSHPERELQAIGKINLRSFQSSFLTEPLSKEAYQTLYVPQFSEYLSEYCFFLLNPKGEEVGYFFSFEDQGYLVWKTLAILPEYQGLGLSVFGMHQTLLLAKQRGVDQMVSALIRRGAQSEVLLQKIFNLKWEHHYAVFKKEIALSNDSRKVDAAQSSV